MYDTEVLFNIAKNNILLNTSYPLKVDLWKPFRVQKLDLFRQNEGMSFYIHIPFCTNRCKFCEYTTFKNIGYIDQLDYVNNLSQEMNRFVRDKGYTKLYGFDIGGGTPTSLENWPFEKLMYNVGSIMSLNDHVEDFEPSIESDFQNMTDTKIKIIPMAGIKRVSFGMQTYSKKILFNNARTELSLQKIEDVISKLKNFGVEKVNIDLMYGLPGQDIEDILNTIDIVSKLNVEQITVYETRYNCIDMKHIVTREELYNQYQKIYDKIIELGYIGRFGQNTFSKFNDDGLSSYLRYRVKKFIPYKGFGISAQSMSHTGLSYNIGKSIKQFENVKGSEEFVYQLPPEEIVAKYVCISLYYGSFNIGIIDNIMGYPAFRNEITFLKNRGYIQIDDNTITITPKGYRYYGAIGTLFYSDMHKNYLIMEKNDELFQDCKHNG